jgi:hypothetical protein
MGTWRGATRRRWEQRPPKLAAPVRPSAAGSVGRGGWSDRGPWTWMRIWPAAPCRTAPPPRQGSHGRDAADACSSLGISRPCQGGAATSSTKLRSHLLLHVVTGRPPCAPPRRSSVPPPPLPSGRSASAPRRRAPRAGPPWEGEEETGGRWARGRRERKGGRRRGGVGVNKSEYDMWVPC